MCPGSAVVSDAVAAVIGGDESLLLTSVEFTLAWVYGVGIFYSVFDKEFAIVAACYYALVFYLYEAVVFSLCIGSFARLFDCHSPLLPVGFSV